MRASGVPLRDELPPIPRPALAAMPRDAHGRIVTWTTGCTDAGEPLMGTNSGAHVARAILEGLCGACGTPLEYWIAFLGSAECVERRDFMEPPMHVDCARYSVAVCPYLASPRYESGRDRSAAGVIQVADRARPERMALYVTRSYKPKFDSAVPMSRAAPPKRLEWF